MNLTNEQKDIINNIRNNMTKVCNNIGSLEVMYLKRKSILMQEHDEAYDKLSQYINAIAMANNIDVTKMSFSIETMSFEPIKTEQATLAVVK